jgi:cytochrome c peroxidase
VPSLRNVTLTPPYFQDGQVSSLNEAVRLMGWMQLDKSLKPEETAEIVRFLRTLEFERHPLDATAAPTK